MSITSVMTDDHRACDGLFVAAEQALERGDRAAARTWLNRFCEAVRTHFDTEERDLFPRFEKATGMTQGPTRMMRLEHEEMRELMQRLAAALDDGDEEDFHGEAETLLIMMQQHNMKEENILYPMCDAHLHGADDALATQLQGARKHEQDC